MSKLKVNEVQANTTSQVTVKSNMVTEAGITNSGGTVSLGTQTGFQSTGIDDNATGTKITVQDATPQVDVSGTVNATGLTVGGVAVSIGPSVRSRGKMTFVLTYIVASGTVQSIASITKVGTGFNYTSATSGAGVSVRVNFASADFDGTEATNMVQVHTNTVNTGIFPSSVSLSETDTSMDISFHVDSGSGSGTATLNCELDFVVIA